MGRKSTLGLGLSGLALCSLIACSDDERRSRGDDDDDGGGGGVAGTGGVGGTPTGTAGTGGTGGNTTTTTSTGGNDPCASGPLALPIPSCAPNPPPSTGDFHQDCVDRINQFRWECQCLPPLQRWTEAESCTDQQSADDQNGGGPHGNFGACGENAQNTCPNWGSEGQVIGGCLQMMWDEGPGEPFSEHGHYINMSSTQYGRVACGSSVSSDGVWSNQNFKP